MQNFKLLAGVIGGTLVAVLAIAYLFTSQDGAEPRVADLGIVQGDMRHIKSTSPETEEEGGEEALEEESEEATASAVEETTTMITMVEFSDFQCPACRAAQPLLQQILDEYPGQVQLVYRHFPLEQIHNNARLAAISSEVAATQDLFWEYHDLLFDNQTEWSASSNPTELFTGYAVELGMDADDFVAGLADNQFDALVETDLRDGFALGVQGTPSVFVDGVQVNIAQLSDYIAALID